MRMEHKNKTLRGKFIRVALALTAFAVIPLGNMQALSQEFVSLPPGMEAELSSAPALVDWDDETLVV